MSEKMKAIEQLEELTRNLITRVSYLEQTKMYSHARSKARLSRIEKLEETQLDINGRINRLDTRVVCGVEGHKFRMESAHQYFSVIDGPPRLHRIAGKFKCDSCGLTYTRELTAVEVRSAIELGYDFPVPEEKHDEDS
jgi:hypothetical protein